MKFLFSDESYSTFILSKGNIENEFSFQSESLNTFIYKTV